MDGQGNDDALRLALAASFESFRLEERARQDKKLVQPEVKTQEVFPSPMLMGLN
jgi:hypothetical protein